MATSERGDSLQIPSDVSHEHDELLECVEECLNCLVVCTTTLQHCLAKGDVHSDVNLVGVLMDCADICQTNANFMLRGSPYHIVTSTACAEICRACEEICHTIPDDEQLAHCAEVCDGCAECCDAIGEMDGDG